MGSEPMTVNRDGLTNLLTRSQFLLTVAGSMVHVQSLSMIFVNLDRFRLVNENFTYAQGDLLLKEIASRIVHQAPDNCFISRFGGDEFVVSCFDLNHEQSLAVAENIRHALSQPHHVDGSNVVVTASIGVTTDVCVNATVETALQMAETASQRAKELGRNRVCSALPPEEFEMSPLRVETLLRNALQNRDLEIYYQPKVQTKSMQVIGAEALCRWRHPEYGEIPPHRFIPVAESSDLILPVDEYVLRAVCEQGKRWLMDGYRVRMSVNVSSRQFQQPDFTQLVKEILQQTGMDPSLLELEITERTAMTDVDHAVTVLTELREIGVRVAIDDFGIGYSSLSYLMRFPIHTLKIDRSFTAGIEGSLNQNPVIGAIISLAKSLNLNVVAEGVETFQQFDFLRENACDEIQGYLFGKPVPPSSFRLSSFSSTPQPRGSSHIAGQESLLANQLNEFEWLERIGMAALRRPSLPELVSCLPDFILERIPFDRFSIELASSDDMYCLVHEGSIRDDIPSRPVGTLVPVAHSGIGFLRKTKLPSLCRDILHHPEFTEDYSLSAQGIRSIVRVPLLHGNEVYGMITLQSAHPDVYLDNDRRLLQRLATRLGDTIYAAQQNDYLWRRASFDECTQTFTRDFLAKLLEAEDPAQLLSIACQRPFTTLQQVSVIYLALEGVDVYHLEDTEQAASHLGEMIHSQHVGQSTSIRVGATELLVLMFGDAEQQTANLTEVLAEQLHIHRVRAQRMGDTSRAFDVRIGQASGQWNDFSTLYRASVSQAKSLLSWSSQTSSLRSPYL